MRHGAACRLLKKFGAEIALSIPELPGSWRAKLGDYELSWYADSSGTYLMQYRRPKWQPQWFDCGGFSAFIERATRKKVSYGNYRFELGPDRTLKLNSTLRVLLGRECLVRLMDPHSLVMGSALVADELPAGVLLDWLKDKGHVRDE